jgi:pimeloyl-ACP methyl ester carboxylesterase
VASLLLSAPGGALIAEATPDLRAFFDAERSALSRDDLDAAVEANVTAWVVGAGRTATDVDDEVIASVRAMQRRAFEIAQRWGDVDTVELDPPPTERFGELTAPTLVLVGTHDMDTVLDAAERLASEVDGARSLTWSDVAHLPALERPARFVQVLDDWLAQSSGART